MTDDKEHIFRKYPELVEIVQFLKEEIAHCQRPANETILDDVDLRNLLKVSKRTTSTYRSSRLIAHSFLGGKVFYILEDVIKAIKKNRIPTDWENLRIKL